MIKKSIILKMSEFFSGNISPTVLGAFFRKTETIDDKYVFAYFNFRTSKYGSTVTDSHIKQCVKSLNLYSGAYPFWQVNDSKKKDSIYVSSKYKGIFILENDIGISCSYSETNGNNFLNRLINKIRSEEFFSDLSKEEERRAFIRGYLDVSMSYDGGNWLACDYVCQNREDVRKISILMEYNLLSPEFYNINPRFTIGTKKKPDQLRVSVKYYMSRIGTYNGYRAKCLKKGSVAFKKKSLNIENGIYYYDIDYKEHDARARNKRITAFVTSYQNFVNVAHGYRILKKQSEEDIANIRDMLGLNETTEEEKKKNRKKSIVDQVLANEPDECLCCKNKYSISDRSFLQDRKEHGVVVERYYFEVHHAISFSNEKNSEENVLDVIENLGKICPACHACMTGKKGREEEIKILISNILKNSDKIRSFAEGYFGTSDFTELVNSVYEKLR